MPIISGGSTSSGGGSSDGWTADVNTWTYASATTFTITGQNLTTTYTKGTRLKLTQTTVKYFVVVGSSFGGGNTTVTITGGSDYTLANAAITANYYSYQASPQGYPGFFNYTPTATGLSSALTINVANFNVIGNMCYVFLDVFGTSNAATFTVDAPVPPDTTNYTLAEVLTINNGANGAGRVDTTTSPVRYGSSLANPGGFTASGTKGTSGGFTYRF